VNPLRFNNVQSREVQRKLNQDFFIGNDFPGMRDLKQEAMNVETVIPPTRGVSRFSEKKELIVPDDYDEFLKRYPETILVAFGTTWIPLSRA
jgi:hypothetical protein